jgi:hypothetical protein
MKYIALTFFLTLSGLQANAKAHNTGLLSSLNIGIRYSSILERRGVTLYNDFQVDPVFGIFLLDDKVEIFGDSISYHDFVFEDKIRLRTRLQQISDKPLFPSYASVKDNYPERNDSFEWVVGAEFFLPSYDNDYKAEIDLTYAKDLKEHFGNYLDVLAKVKVYEFNLFNYRIEPNVFGSVGWGDSAHNQYLYGPSASQDGFNNANYGLWFAFPDEADRYYPILLLSHYSVLGSQNRNAEYARGRNEGYLFSLIATVGVLD